MNEHNCEKCGESSDTGEVIYDIGFICDRCLSAIENKTGYCSMQCQLFGDCDGSC